MEEEINFEGLKYEVIEMEKTLWQIKNLIIAFAQPTNWDNFSYEDHSESQEDEIDSRSQVSQRNIWLIKHKKYE